MRRSEVVHTLLRDRGPTLVSHGRNPVERRKDCRRPAQPPLRLQDMRDAKRQNRRRRPAGDVPEISVVWADAGTVSDDEARELLEHGLRILARLIVRAHLRREASLPATNPGERSPDNPNAD